MSNNGTEPYGVLPYGDADTPNDSLTADVQKSSPGDLIVLYDIDTGPIGGSDVWHLCSGTVNGVYPIWRGNTYLAYPIIGEGFEWSGRGTLPKPKLTVGNVLRLLQGAVIQYNDLLGAKVTRWKTLTKYLDNGTNPNSEIHFSPDIYYIDRKAAQTRTHMEFELAAILDQQGKVLPARQIIRDSCAFRYRRWNGSTWVYDTTDMACPYTGGAMYTNVDVGTSNPTLDVCGKRLTSCKLRFGANAALPFGGFPSVSRNR